MTNQPTDNDFIDIPITQEFDSSHPIGYAKISKKVFDQYPADSYVFAPGVIVQDRDENGTITKAALIEISLIPGQQYIDWYKHKKDGKTD